MIKGVIFDMDGVIVDSEPLWEKSLVVYLDSLGITFKTSRKFNAYINQHFRGRGQQEVTAKIKKLFKLPDGVDKIVKDRMKTVFQIFDRELKPVPGSLPFIRKLHRQKIPLALASSSPVKAIGYVVKKYQLKKYFSYIISGDQIRRKKPNPDIFLHVARKMSIKPENILVIEDSVNGVMAAKRARMKCIAIKQPYTPISKIRSANLIVKNLNKLSLKAINKL